jgi:hypothetical protein
MIFWKRRRRLKAAEPSRPIYGLGCDQARCNDSGLCAQRPKEKQRQLTFVSLIAFLMPFSRANRPDRPVLTSMNTISHDEIGETEN